MKKQTGWILLGLFCLLSVSTVNTQPAPQAEGVVRATSETIGSDLKPILSELLAGDLAPALAAAVIREGRIVALGATGVRKWGDETPVTKEDRFHLGSCTKAMTATLTALSIQSGKLNWETTLAEVFPEWKETMRPEYRAVTVEHLLAHRAGLPGPEGSWPRGKTFNDMWNLPGSPRDQRLACVELFLKQKPISAPGAKYQYSNVGYLFLGAILERVENTEWETLIHRRLFEPLEMTSAGIGPPGRPETVDEPWAHSFKNGRLVPVPPTPRSDNPDTIAPGGKVHCSLRDWARFISLQMAGARGEENLLEPNVWRRLLTPPFEGHYAGGWLWTRRDWAKGPVMHHAGTNTKNYAVAWLAPDQDFAVLVATNFGGQTAEKLCDRTAARLIALYQPAEK